MADQEEITEALAFISNHLSRIADALEFLAKRANPSFMTGPEKERADRENFGR